MVMVIRICFSGPTAPRLATSWTPRLEGVVGGYSMNAVDGYPDEILNEVALTPEFQPVEVCEKARIFWRYWGICEDEEVLVALDSLIRLVKPPSIEDRGSLGTHGDSATHFDEICEDSINQEMLRVRGRGGENQRKTTAGLCRHLACFSPTFCKPLQKILSIFSTDK